MTRRFGIPLSGATCLVLVGPFLLGGMLSRTEAPARPVAFVPPSDAGGQRYVGSRSCAATACHNGNDPDRFGSEYRVWSSRDPHARAGAVLEGRRAQDMVRRWRGQDGDAAQEPACLACHAPLSAPGGATAEEGVSCESCHGPAGQWLDVHYTEDWRRLTPADKERQGFRPTRNIAYRVGLCADCHVGRPGAEVDHDLIAAGHPHLTFEYAAYHELLPRHWLENTYGKDFAARAWEIGQVVVAGKATALLESRAAAAGPSATLRPEFAECDCFACHHDLRAASWRQESGYGGRPPGLPAWGTWPLSMTAVLAKDGGLDHAIITPADEIDRLRRTMLRPRPMCGEVRDQAAAAAAALTHWAEALQGAADPAAAGHRALDKDRVRTLLLRLAAPQAEGGPADWDQAAQTYLAVAALYQTLAELNRTYPTPGRRAAVEELRDAVCFPNRPPGGASDSPADFTPARFRQALKLIQSAFGD